MNPANNQGIPGRISTFLWSALPRLAGGGVKWAVFTGLKVEVSFRVRKVLQEFMTYACRPMKWNESAKSWTCMGADLRLGRYMPASLFRLINQTFTTPGKDIVSSCENIFSTEEKPVSESFLFYSAFFEEILFRGMIQQIALRALPKAILRKTYPAQEHLVDHQVLRIGRVVLSSAIFAIIHINKWDSNCEGVAHQFLGGLVFGAQAELSDSLLLSTFTHYIYNSRQIAEDIRLYQAIIE